MTKAPHPEPAPTYDSSDPEQVAKREIDAARRDKERLDVIAGIMATSAGRAWIWDELVEAKIFQTTFVSGDPMASAFQEGQRNAGLRKFAQVMRAAPEMYPVMASENSK